MIHPNRRGLLLPAFLAATCLPCAAQAPGARTVADLRAQVDGAADWAGLVYAGAAAAVHSGDPAAVEAALSEIARLEGGSVDAPLGARPFPVDAALSAVEREAYVVDVVLTYLHPETAGESIRCGVVSARDISTFDERGEREGLAEATMSCSAGPVGFSYVGQQTRVDGGTLDVEAFEFGDLPISVRVSSRGSVVIEPGTDYATLLALAAGSGHAAVVDRLIRAGASPNARSESGRTALMDAATTGQRATVQALLVGGAAPNLESPDGRTALHFAAEADHLSTVEALLAGGADPSVEDMEGRTALHSAVGDLVAVEGIVERLVVAGAPLERSTVSGHRALHLALEHGHVEAALRLLRHGADAAAPDGDGRTPLTLALWAGVDLLEPLVAGGADLSAPDGQGWTALHHAVRAADPGLVVELLRLGAQVDVPATDGSTTLMLAAEAGDVGALGLLLEAGADLEATDSAGNTPLHRAAAAGRDRTAERLMRAGADRGARNARGRSPQDLAGDNGHGSVQSLFRHTKRLHFAPLKGAVGLTRLADPQHESSVGWEYGVGLGLRLHERVRLQGEIAWATRTTDPSEDGPIVVQPGSGDFYYAAYSVDVRPMVRIALGNPYRTHPYTVAGVNLSTVEEAEILDWVDTDADGVIVTDRSETVTSLIGGLGVQATLGRVVTSVEILLSRSSTLRLEPFEGPMESVTVGLSFAW